MPVFSRVVPPIASAYVLQSLFALIFVPQENDKFYDLGGTLGFLSSTFLSLYYPALISKFIDGIPAALPALSTFAPRQLLLSAALGIWTLRMGSFLTLRSIRTGGDARFEDTKKQPGLFTVFWIAQATWIALIGLPVYLCNSTPASVHPNLGLRDYAALGLIATSFLFEVVADNQKFAWRLAKDNKQHNDKFITGGLWSISRHPNYVGEVGLWTGVWALSTAALQTVYFPKGTVALAAISPFFTWFLLRHVTGVPILERSADHKFGKDPKWQEYKRTVPIFWPWGSGN
ncbi:DUF1295-domain-containing protein [Tricholoma matsutake]|nr:DUF1295-domain-containing protein [Tricholoma matsutake 945]